MFEPIEIHGPEGFDEYYTRVEWSEEDGAIMLSNFDSLTGELDGDEYLFGPEEAGQLGHALLAASDAVWVAQMAKAAAEREAERNAERARVAEMAAEDRSRKEALASSNYRPVPFGL